MKNPLQIGILLLIAILAGTIVWRILLFFMAVVSIFVPFAVAGAIFLILYGIFTKNKPLGGGGRSRLP